jgi:hypothetical protein
MSGTVAAQVGEGSALSGSGITSKVNLDDSFSMGTISVNGIRTV